LNAPCLNSSAKTCPGKPTTAGKSWRHSALRMSSPAKTFSPPARNDPGTRCNPLSPNNDPSAGK
jgi:hypothetical protein